MRRASKEAQSHTTGHVRTQAFLLSNSSVVNKGSKQNSPVRIEAKIHGYEEPTSAPQPVPEDTSLFVGFPTSRWIEVPSSLPICPVFVAKPLFHYTLCNVH